MELPDLLAAYANDNRICLIDNTLKIEGSSISIKGINGALSPFFAAGSTLPLQWKFGQITIIYL